jgi:NitT/TauT family transport system substrate-binding protein
LKKTFILITLLLISCSEKKTEKLIVTGPFGPLIYPLVYMNQQNGGKDFELKIWNNPDQLRAIIAGKQADIAALPTNTALALFNKGVDLKLACVSLWSVLWIVSSDSSKKSLKDFKNEEIVMAFKGDIPNVIFKNIAKKQGLDPEKDFKIRYVNTPLDAVQQLFTGNAQNAVLSEPEVSTLILKTEKENNGIKFFRAVDLQEEWGRIYGTQEKIPLGCMVILNQNKDKTALINNFINEYISAVEWCNKNPVKLGEIIESQFKGRDKESNIEAMKHIKLEYVNQADSKNALEQFYKVILEGNPASIGNKLPSDDFYLKK